MTPLETLFYYIKERWLIRERRLIGVKFPWTNDPILQKYSFTNVFREHDRTSQWLLRHWFVPFASSHMLPFSCAVARLINWQETLAELTPIVFPKEADGEPADVWNPHEAVRIMQERKQRGEKVYTSAYMLTGSGAEAYEGDKARLTIMGFITPIFNRWPFDPSDTLEKAYERLVGHPGCGPFIAQEIVQDLLMSSYLKDPADRYTFAVAGPGAMRGLNRIFGRELDKQLRQSDAQLEMRTLRDEWGKWSSQQQVKGMPHLSVHNIEFALCEVDKYLRVQNGEGRPRANYRPGKELP